ncbi:hypothetical protein [Streptomyces asoensis]|uniref:Integral membrane protein n=1 Tax=Streptomyces asoensis TaxID=249586 RepID=A0ABQ3S4P1_9ACTN|nr:hypothetical protein [Streptomyces asoensis]GGQ66317.1 hypothetical protein GCM10010496_32260 [Streptomyces asoensis]GHI63093.1 hypothetical protein Saso_47430 [Streptomyces asoensis]
MIQPGRGRQILLFGMLALVCGVLLLALSSGGPATAFGWLLVAGGALCVPVSLLSRKKGQG